MSSLLFHKDVFIPEHARQPLHQGALRYGNHASHVSTNGGDYADIELPRQFSAEDAILIEAELDAKTGQVIKQVWRQRMNEEWDLCFPMLAGGFVKTVWLNRRTDTHKTLDKKKFVGGYQWRCMKNKLSGVQPVRA